MKTAKFNLTSLIRDFVVANPGVTAHAVMTWVRPICAHREAELPRLNEVVCRLADLIADGSLESIAVDGRGVERVTIYYPHTCRVVRNRGGKRDTID